MVYCAAPVVVPSSYSRLICCLEAPTESVRRLSKHYFPFWEVRAIELMLGTRRYTELLAWRVSATHLSHRLTNGLHEVSTILTVRLPRLTSISPFTDQRKDHDVPRKSIVLDRMHGVVKLYYLMLSLLLSNARCVRSNAERENETLVPAGTEYICKCKPILAPSPSFSSSLFCLKHVHCATTSITSGLPYI